MDEIQITNDEFQNGFLADFVIRRFRISLVIFSSTFPAFSVSLSFSKAAFARRQAATAWPWRPSFS